MTPYKVNLLGDYSSKRDLGSRISQLILNRKIPQPEDIVEVLGQEAVEAYYFMHALFHSIEHGRGRLLDYARRDQKAIQRHSFDAAFKPVYRFKDSSLPSKYVLTPREITGVLVHDLAEEFGKNLLGALVVNDTIRYLLREEAGNDATLLTNMNALLLDYHERELSKLEQIDHERIYNLLNDKKSQINVKPRTVQWQYQRILRALKHFEEYVKHKVDYIPDSQKEELISIINRLSEKLKIKIRSKELLTPDNLTELIMQQYAHVIGIVERGESEGYIEVDSRLLLPEEPEFLLTLKKTLYRDFVDKIKRQVMTNAISASQNGGIIDDSYLAPMIEKIAECTDTVSNMDYILTNAVSIFRKARVVLASGLDLTRDLKELSVEHQRLQRGIEYLFRKLDGKVDMHLRHFEEDKEQETAYGQDVEIFKTMNEKMKDLEMIVNAMGESTLVSESIKLKHQGRREISVGGETFTL